jgi:creatinine amidohydrolase
MTVRRWAETDRETLTRILPDALVLLPIGATEQHGPYLPTGTDHLLAAVVTARAAERAGTVIATDLVITPTLPVGASDHHLPFGGTLSITPATLTTMLTEILSSIVACGGRRVLIINGHGGNQGGCAAAAAAATNAAPGLIVGHLDYWAAGGQDQSRWAVRHSCTGPVPGHAGEFETAMIMAVRPELVLDRPIRSDPPTAGSAAGGAAIHGSAVWAAIDGYTDHPERATAAQGQELLDELVTATEAVIIELAQEESS